MMRQMQRLGRALMQAVAVMPVAALMLGIGYWIDSDGWGANNALAAVLVQSGDAILASLGIIFAVAVAYGLSKDNNGAAALSGLVGFLVVTKLLNPGTVSQLRGGAEVLDTEGFGAIGNGNVFIGIIVGILAAWVYNRFHNKKLPDAFAFFSGRRMVPIITSFLALVLSGILLFIWPAIYSALVAFGTTLTGMGAFGAAVYGFFNRLLIPTGLHHALNQVFWFDLVGINDIGNFWGNVQSTLPGVTTGMYQAGFFPIMMFGLPGAALAMYHTAKPERKPVIRSLMLAGAVASFVTGVTEPIEFAFMFLAPALYVVHAVLTGISLFIAATLKWIAGFGFSAGLIDMLLSINIPLATNWYMLIPLGLVFFAIYYFLFRFIITRFNLKTPGREDEIDVTEGQELSADTNFTVMAEQILEGLGGKDNIADLDYCVTRLRVNVKDHAQVRENLIRRAPISGIIRPSQKSVQVVVGPQVQFVYDEMQKLI
ncbi:MAG TPA: PTS transporter subunit EIIC [Tissierellia bacterium]|nr:PTS transporter subunit EIIC [Tissierellia bacterium]